MFSSRFDDFRRIVVYAIREIQNILFPLMISFFKIMLVLSDIMNSNP